MDCILRNLTPRVNYVKARPQDIFRLIFSVMFIFFLFEILYVLHFEFCSSWNSAQHFDDLVCVIDGLVEIKSNDFQGH
jgi:hypothetical protein